MSRYCTRLESPAFWGGEVEILVLSKMLRMPIHVMQRALDVGRCATFCSHQADAQAMARHPPEVEVYAALPSLWFVVDHGAIPMAYSLLSELIVVRQSCCSCACDQEHMSLHSRTCSLFCREEKGYVPIAKYGEEFEVAKKGRKARKAVKLFYSAGNHYDLLLPSLL